MPLTSITWAHLANAIFLPFFRLHKHRDHRKPTAASGPPVSPPPPSSGDLPLWCPQSARPMAYFRCSPKHPLKLCCPPIRLGMLADLVRYSPIRSPKLHCLPIHVSGRLEVTGLLRPCSVPSLPLPCGVAGCYHYPCHAAVRMPPSTDPPLHSCTLACHRSAARHLLAASMARGRDWGAGEGNWGGQEQERRMGLHCGTRPPLVGLVGGQKS